MRSSKKWPRIHLYDDPSSKTLDLQGIASYLEETVLLRTDVKANFESLHFPKSSLQEVSRRTASSRVGDPGAEFQPKEPIYGEIEFERKLVSDPSRRAHGVLYDGFELQTLYSEFLGEEEAGPDHIHIAFTSRLIGTYDEDDKRYHARAIVCGFPSIISTSGIVEGPSKPREFYLAIRALTDPSLQSMAWEKLKEEFKEKFIDYDDERLTEVLRGYAMQGVFYHLFLDPFCEERTCMLFNSRWQEDVIRSQLLSGRYCPRHLEVLKGLVGENEPKAVWLS